VFVRNRSGAPWRERGGLVSRILLQEEDVPGAGFRATWVEVAPGSRQRLHDHVAEQVYVILRGLGKMRVGEEERRVEEGEDLVYVPPGALRGIENASEVALVYVSAATPVLNAEAAYDTGRLRERPGDRKGGRRAHG
jgi:mannose-6-phosphate isomerase-like protein (cupin superfamily)